MEILNQQQCVFVDDCMHTVHSGVNGGSYCTCIYYRVLYRIQLTGHWCLVVVEQAVDQVVTTILVASQYVHLLAEEGNLQHDLLCHNDVTCIAIKRLTPC